MPAVARISAISTQLISNIVVRCCVCAVTLVCFAGTVHAGPTPDLKSEPQLQSDHGQIRQVEPDLHSPRSGPVSQQKGNTEKIGSFLRRGTLASPEQRKAVPFLEFKDGNKIQVYIKLSSCNQQDITQLEMLGAEVEVVNKKLNKVQAWVTSSQLDALIKLDNVEKIFRPSIALPRSGSVVTQGDTLLKSDQLRSLGLSGRGIRVGIVSDGANNWVSARTSGDLPAKLTRYGSCSRRSADPQNCRFARTCNEGTAMAEIIHDIAPEAELAVASANTSLEFIQQINRLADEFKADIIVDDLGFFGEPYFGGGEIADAVAALPEDILYVSSAGNSARIHYTANFNYSNFSNQEFDATHSHLRGQNGSTDIFHGFLVPKNSGTIVILQWEGRDIVRGMGDLALNVYDQTSLVGRSDVQNDLSTGPIEALCIPNTSTRDVVRFATMKLNSGLTSMRFKMFFLGAAAIEYPIARESIFGHPALPSVLAVGSINADDPRNDDIAFYSSQGPARINRLNEDSTFVVGDQLLPKPDLVAIDGVNVTGAGGFRTPFYGTSAAAPHVAGVAALLMSKSPFASANKVREALINGAFDLGARGRDNIFGYGRVDALAAGAALKAGNPIPAILMLLEEEVTP